MNTHGNVLNNYLQVMVLGKNTIGFHMQDDRLVTIPEALAVAVLEETKRTGESVITGFATMDALRKLIHGKDMMTGCCVFVNTRIAQKLGLVLHNDTFIFNDPSRLN